jgi:hypothetical protein
MLGCFEKLEEKKKYFLVNPLWFLKRNISYLYSYPSLYNRYLGVKPKPNTSSWGMGVGL